jgi:two-component system response regulator (stage 0 sporulation protein A)
MEITRMVISNTLKTLGIPVSLQGYRYIICGVELLIEDINRIDSILGLYCDIAEKCNTTYTRAERSIRHAIETGWTRGNTKLEKKLFGYTVDYNKGKPTNGEFLGTIADYLLMAKDCPELLDDVLEESYE